MSFHYKGKTESFERNVDLKKKAIIFSSKNEQIHIYKSSLFDF